MTPPTMYEGPKPTGKTVAGLATLTGKEGRQASRRGQGQRSSPLLFIGGLIVIAVLGAQLYKRYNPDAPVSEKIDQLFAAARSPLAALSEHVQLPSVARSLLGSHEDPRSTHPASAKKAAARQSKKTQADRGEKKSLPSTAAPESFIENPTTLFLKNGERVIGELVSQSADEVVLRWEYGEASFKRSEILDMILPPSAGQGEAVGLVKKRGGFVTVLLLRGGSASGELLYDLPQEIVLKMDSGEVTFQKGEIKSITPATPE